MRTFTIHPLSMLSGAALAAAAFVAMAQKPAPAKTAYEYEILTDVELDQVVEMARGNWEFVGYLGQSKKGIGSDETLWRRLR